MRVINIVIILSFLTACVAVPGIIEKKSYNDECELLTKKMHINVKAPPLGVFSDITEHPILTTEAGLIVLAASSIPFSASLVVSGSIVLTGNTLHWLERYGRCHTDVVEAQTRELLNVDEIKTVELNSNEFLECNVKSGKCIIW